MMEKYITDERTGLKYELVGDYYLIAGDDEPEEDQPIGVWGQWHLRHLKRHHKVIYANLLTSGKLPEYLADIDRRAEELFLRLAKTNGRNGRRNGSPQSRKPDALGAEKPVDAGFLFAWVNRKRPIGRSILISGGDGGVTAKRGLFWYVDGELLCFPVSGAEVDTVSNNHRRFWETLPHSLTGGMPYNYFPRGRVELRHGKAMVYLHPTLCTPEIDARIRQAFSLPDEMQVSLKADGSRHYRSTQEEQEG